MKRLITILAASLFILVTAHGQVPIPQITLTGNIGAGFVGPLFNSGNLVYASDANRTMAYPETSAFIIKVTSTVSLTATRNLIAPVGYFPFVIENLTTGGQSIQFIGTSGTGITIPNGSAAFIAGDGTNYFSLTGSGGGGSGVASINGTTGAFTFAGSGVSCTSTTCTFSSGSGMVYPSGSGVAVVSGGTSWGTTLPVAGAGAGVTTGPTSGATSGDIALFTGGAGQITDGVIAGANLMLLSGTQTVTGTKTFSAATNFTAGVTAGPDGTHAGIVAIYGNTANPTIPANEFGWLGFNSTSATAYFLQPSTTAPVGPAVMVAATPSGNVSQVTYLSNLGTVNGVTFPVGGAITTPVVCGGNGTTCLLQQINPTTGATTTTSASMTTGQTTIPVTSGTGFTFAPGNIVGIANSSPTEWIACTGYSSPNLTGCTRALYGSTAAAWTSGSTVVQMTLGYSTASTVAPYFYTLANGAIGYNGSGSLTANTTTFAGFTNITGGAIIGGSTVQLNASTGSSLYTAQAATLNSGAGSCGTSGIVHSTGSGSYTWFEGDTTSGCTVGTNLVPAGAFVFVAPATSGTAPTTGATPQGWITQGGEINAKTGFQINGAAPLNHCPVGNGTDYVDSSSCGGSSLPSLTTLSGTTPAITATNILQTITLSGNTTPTVTGIVTGVQVRMQICQPATGGPYTWTWPSAIHGGIAIGTTASTCSMQTFNSFSGTTLVPESIGIINVAP